VFVTCLIEAIMIQDLDEVDIVEDDNGGDGVDQQGADIAAK
jgi:hypothetical protein